MTYYPADHDVFLFGGYSLVGPSRGGITGGFFNDTWAFSNNHWTELVSIANCTSTTCPSPRAEAMVAYYAPMNAILLFGGYVYDESDVPVPLGDTWLFYNATWHNITATAGTAPSPRFDGAVVWDSLDNYVVLFGGSLYNGVTLADTWTFTGTWTNITASLSFAPSNRAGAAISNSPSGYIMLFGGESDGTAIEDGCLTSTSVVDYWFYHGAWLQMSKEATCSQGPEGPLDVLSNMPPCGRVDPALGWDLRNERFVLYGGLGPENETDCLGPADVYLNDTYLYLDPLGGDFNWQNVTSDGAPSVGRAQMGYASDYSDGYFEIFGGLPYPFPIGLNDTWRFFEFVHAKLTGPASIDTNATNVFPTPFTVKGYGGSGDLSYKFLPPVLLRNQNPLVDGGSSYCDNLTDGATFGPIPVTGIWLINCMPTQQSYNIFRLTLDVWDAENLTDSATSSWTVTVIPPETATILSEFAQYFFHGFSFQNTFSAYLNVANTPATQVIATIGGVTLPFYQRSSGSYWWDTHSLDMGSVTPGAEILLQANFAGWSLNTTYQTEIVDTPSWLSSLFTDAGATQTVQTAGSGSYNKVFWINETFDWDLSDALGFSIPIPLVGGSYSLIPDVKVVVSASSTGNLSLAGTFSLKTPDINIGVFSLQLSASISMSGTFALVGDGAAVSGIQWVGAGANVSVAGSFSGSVPIYGFNILGVTIGFVLDLSVNPSVGLSLLLGPLTGGAKAIANGVQLMLDKVFGSFTLPLSVSINFGVGFASVGIGGTLSIALEFSAYPSLGIDDGWVNGSLFVQASAFCWSDSWNLVGPGVIYSWDPPAGGAGLRPSAGSIGTQYDNGTNTTWSLESRYYDTASYNSLVWNASSAAGPAIADIYPHTEVGAAAGDNGAYIFYTNDNVSLPVQDGLTVSGVRLDGDSNRLASLPSPNDPNFILANPVATTLPDGNLYVAWAAIPDAETSDASPLDLSSVQLHGAEFYPSTQTWGPVHTWTDWGLAESYQLDGSGPTPTLVALVSSTPLIGETSPERLVEFDLTNTTEVSNVSVSGIGEIGSVRGGPGEAAVQLVDGNTTVVSLSTGLVAPVSVSVPSNATLISENFAVGSSTTLALLYREPNASEVVLYDLATQTTVATLPVGVGTVSVEAYEGIGTTYVVASSASGIEAWSVEEGTFQLVASVPQPYTKSFEVVQAGSALVVVSLVTNGNTTVPVATLTLDEIPAALPSVPGQSSSSPSSGSTSTLPYLLYLAIAAGIVVLLLAVVAIVSRRRTRASPQVSAPPEAPPPPPSGESPPPPSE